MLISKLSIGAWNIGGANNLDDPEFIKLIERHHIIVFTETFSSKDSTPIHLPGFISKNVFRKKKHKKASRNSGGLSVLTKNELSKFVTPVRVTSEHFIWLKINKSLTGYEKDLYLCGAYIPPNGSPYYESHPDLDIFSNLTNDIAYFSRTGHILITGDLNSRLGLRSDLPAFDRFDNSLDFESIPPPIIARPRHSMDNVTNTWGNKLIELCNTCNMCVLNGRTLGDFSGRLTYFATNGHSTIDLTLVDRAMLDNTISFHVSDLNELSHHCKIETIIKCKPFNVEKTEVPLNSVSFDKFVWDPKSSPEKLLNVLNTADFDRMTNSVLCKNYSKSDCGTNMLTKDVTDILNHLHTHSCIKMTLGKKKPRHSKAKNQKWFTNDCQLLRERARRTANAFSRDPNNRQKLNDYVLALRAYRKIIKKAKKAHKLNNMKKLIESTDSQELWSLLSEMRGKKSTTPIPMPELVSHFSHILNNPPKKVPPEVIYRLRPKIRNFLNDPLPNEFCFPLGSYSDEFLCKMAKSCKNGKSAFTDGIINEVLKHSIAKIAPLLRKLFTQIESTSIFPADWKSSFLVPIHKKGSKGDPDNYRGLAVGSNMGKFFTKCLNDRLNNYAEKRDLISPNQFGFRVDHRTSDAAFTLQSLITERKINNQPLYACFVDFSKAFDSIDREALSYKLGNFGIRGPLLKLFVNMYDANSYMIKSNNEFSFPIQTSIGLKQGCCLSPILFNMYINDLHQIFGEDCAPTSLNGLNISSLSFADDLVLLSQTKEGLANCLNHLENYCNTWGLKVNDDKTKVLVFNRPFTKNIKNLNYFIDGKKIVTVKSYTYLGIEVTNTGNFQLACKSLYQKSLRAMFSLYAAIGPRSDIPNTQLFLKLFDSLIRPILLYGCEIWGPYIAQPGNIICKFVNKFYRILLGVPNSASTVGIHMELGRYPIAASVYSTMLKYWSRLISLPRSRLVSQSYWSSYDTFNMSNPWLSTIKHIIYSSHFNQIWDNHRNMSDANIKSVSNSLPFMIKCIKNQFLDFSNYKSNLESRLSLLKNTKEKLTLSNYISTIKSDHTRRLLAKLRLGTLQLEIEKGRRAGIPRELRACKLCKKDVVEDESHFIFDCDPFTACRDQHLVEITNHIPFLNFMDSRSKLRYLYFSEKIPQNILLLAGSLLEKLWNARETLRKLMPKINEILG